MLGNFHVQDPLIFVIRSLHSLRINPGTFAFDSQSASCSASPSCSWRPHVLFLNPPSLTSWSDGTMSGSFTYDYKKRKTSETISYGYNTGRLASISNPEAGDISFGTFLWNAARETRYPGGGTGSTGFEPDMRIASTSYQTPDGNSNFERLYTYSLSGDVTSIDSELGPYSYVYDHHRLTGAQNAAVLSRPDCVMRV